jgi:hypothetical protein
LIPIEGLIDDLAESLIPRLARKVPFDRATGSRQPSAKILMAPWGFSLAVTVHRGQQRLSRILTNFLLRFGRLPVSAWSLFLALVAVSIAHLSDMIPDSASVLAAAFTALGSPTQVAITGLAGLGVSLVPWVILLFFVLSQTGRRAAFRNNTQLVAEATRALSKLASALVVLADTAYRNRRDLVGGRERRVMNALHRASNGRIFWLDGVKPKLRERSLYPRHNWVHSNQAAREAEKNGALAASLLDAARKLDGIMQSIDEDGLGIICAKVCTPIYVGVLPALGGYGEWNFRPGSLAPSLRITAIMDAQKQVVEIMTDLESDVARALDSESDDDMMETIERIIRASGYDMDKCILQHRLVESELWAMGQFLHRHVLGGRVDQLKK